MSRTEPPPAPPEPEVRTGRLPSLLHPLRNRNYALLFSGQLASMVGDQLYVVALPFLILGRHDVRQLGLVLACFGVARLAALPIGGVLADRMSRTRLMVLTDAGRGCCVLGVAAVAFAAEQPLGPLMVLTAALGACEGLFLPASYAILPDILPEEQLPAGNALTTAVESGAGFIGPVIGGLLVAGATPGLALGLDAATFVVSAVTLLAIRVPRSAPGAAGDAEPDADGGDAAGPGFTRLMIVNRVVQLVVLITLFSNLAFDGMTEVALPVFARDDLGSGAPGFGVLLAVFGAGALVGGLLADAFFTLPRRGLVALGLGVVQGVALVLVPLTHDLVGACALLAASGVTIGLLNVFYMTHLQQQVPSHLLGRTMGVLTVASFGAQPVSVLAAGFVMGTTGVVPVFAAAGLVIVAGYLLALTSRQFRTL